MTYDPNNPNQYDPNQQYYQSPTPPPYGGPQKGNGLPLSIAGLVLAIVAPIIMSIGGGTYSPILVYVGLFLGIAAIALSVIGMVMGVNARKMLPIEARGPATASMVLGIIGVSLATLLTLICGCAACSMISAVGQFRSGLGSLFG